MSRVVCIDSNICIWGIKKEGDQAKVPHAVKFLADLEERKTKILLPIPIIVELLSHIKDDKQKDMILSLLDNQNIIVKPFDKISALKGGELLYKTFTEPEVKEYTAANKVEKSKIKYDALIAAIAIVNKCDCIYTDNIKDLTRYSHGQIKISPMPEFGFQTDLFEKTILI